MLMYDSGEADRSFDAGPDMTISPARVASPSAPPLRERHGYRASSWRTQLFGVACTSGVFALVLAGALIGWRTVEAIVATPALAVFDVQPPAALPEPVREVAEGPQKVEQQPQKPKEEREAPAPPQVRIPITQQSTVPLSPPVEQAKAVADPVPKTTAPKSTPAPPANRTSTNAERTWEAELLAHLEKYRRYPATARARHEQGVAHVRFRMNRAGRVLAVTLLRSSGSALLDRAALETIRRAQPLPNIPDDRPAELELSLPVEFFVGRNR